MILLVQIYRFEGEIRWCDEVVWCNYFLFEGTDVSIEIGGGIGGEGLGDPDGPADLELGVARIVAFGTIVAHLENTSRNPDWK